MAIDYVAAVRNAYRVAERKDLEGWVALFTPDGESNTYMFLPAYLLVPLRIVSKGRHLRLHRRSVRLPQLFSPTSQR